MVIHGADFARRFNYWGGHAHGGRYMGFTSSNNININLGGHYPNVGGMYNFDNYMMMPRPRTKSEKFWDGFDRAMSSLAPIGVGIAAFFAIFKKDKADAPGGNGKADDEQLKADREQYNDLLAKEKNGTIKAEEQKILDDLRTKHPEFDLQTKLDEEKAAREKVEEEKAQLEKDLGKANNEAKEMAPVNPTSTAPADDPADKTTPKDGVKPKGGNNDKVRGGKGADSRKTPAQIEKQEKDDFIYLNGQLMLGKTLTPEQKKRLEEISKKHSDWKFDPNTGDIKAKSNENEDNKFPALKTSDGKMRVQVHFTKEGNRYRIAVAIPGTDKMFTRKDVEFGTSGYNKSIDTKMSEIISDIKKANIPGLDVEKIQFEMNTTDLNNNSYAMHCIEKAGIKSGIIDYSKVDIDKSKPANCKITYYIDRSLNGFDEDNGGFQYSAKAGYALVTTPDGNIHRIDIPSEMQKFSNRKLISDAEKYLNEQAKKFLNDNKWSDVILTRPNA